MSSTTQFASEVDLVAYPNARRLIEYCLPLLDEFLNHTPGEELQSYLNIALHPNTSFFTGLCDLVNKGLEEQWLASVALDGSRYRRSRLCAPCEATRYFSITAVYMDSGYRPATSTHSEEGRREDVYEHTEYSGQFHVHPYGEINAVIPLDHTAELKGMVNWQGAGWTSPEPGSKHFPEARGGRLIALFFLPAGRIAYPHDAPVKAGPNAWQPKLLAEKVVPKDGMTLRAMMGLSNRPNLSGYEAKGGVN